MRREWRFLLLWIAIIGGLVLAWSFTSQAQQQEEIAFSFFNQHLADIEELNFDKLQAEGKFRTSLTYRTPKGENVNVEYFTTTLPGEDTKKDCIDRMDPSTVITASEEDGFAWRYILLLCLPFLILIGFWIYMARRMRDQAGGGPGGVMSMLKMKGRIFEKENRVSTTFDDVAGIEGAKEELKEVIEFLQNPSRFHSLGGTIPKGILLVGPPGTGKTLLARAVAGEAGAPFYSLTGSSFMEMFVGVGAARVRDLFRNARKSAPCIIFLDELDSVGRHRGAGLGGGHDEREQTLNQLLAEMDGFEQTENIVLIAATNRPDILDPALLRPGRFDRQVVVDLPTLREREAILKVHTRRVPLADDVELKELARGTPGHSGADMKNLINEGAILAARRGDHCVRMEDFREAKDKIILGRRREGLVFTEQDKEIVAYHEAGHTVVAWYMPNADPLYKVTIIPRGHSLGSTHQLPAEEKFNFSNDDIRARIGVLLGGRAAEMLVFDTITTGAESDLKQVRRLARKMVCSWGMGKRLRSQSLEDEAGEVFLGQQLLHSRDLSDETAREIDEEIQTIADEGLQAAQSVLRKHRDELNEIATALKEREVLEREDLEKLFREPAASAPLPSPDDKTEQEKTEEKEEGPAAESTSPAVEQSGVPMKRDRKEPGA